MQPMTRSTAAKPASTLTRLPYLVRSVETPVASDDTVIRARRRSPARSRPDTSKAVRRKLSKARREHPRARPRLKIAVAFGMANGLTVTKRLKLKLA